MWRVGITFLAIAAGLAGGGLANLAEAQDKKDDAVFLDEGDGDFDPVPSGGKPGSLSKPVENPTAAAAEMEKSNGASPVAAPEAAPEERHERPAHNPKIGKRAKKPQKSESVVKEAAVPAPEESQAPKVDAADNLQPQIEPPPAEEAKPSKKAKVAKGDAGMYVTTKAVCPIRREPASESEQISATKAPRKIWVQKVDEQWVRAYVRSGDAGYISVDCFE